MRILMLHNRYKIPGGEDVSTSMHISLLRSHGHTVESVEESNDRVDSLGAIRTAARTIWSTESYRRVSRLLAEGGFDLMHVQNFFPLLSPSVYYAARRHRVPVLQSLRNFRLVCPEGMLYRDGQVCMECVGRRVAWPAIEHSCYRDSRAGTSVVVAMSTGHGFAGTWTKLVARYVTPSRFAADVYERAGWDPTILQAIPNYVHPDPGAGTGAGGFAAYVGRLAPPKGIDTLIAAWTQGRLNHPLAIAGDRPLRPMVERAAAAYPAITYLGPLTPGAASDLMGDAAFVVVPTGGIETFGRVAAESLAKGTPAIVSDLGGLAEIIEDRETGLHSRPGDPLDLADRVRWMVEHPLEVRAMRERARESFLARYTGDRVIDQWMSAYRSAIESVEHGT